jgi:MFS family permease
VDNILLNKYLWLFAMANFFVYIVRYSMLDWGPLYLRDVKGADIKGGGIAIFILEFGGIPSTLLMGWLSDKVGGRRGMVSLLCMIPIIGAFWGILINPAGQIWVDMTMLAIIGFFVYPPVMLLGVSALVLPLKRPWVPQRALSGCSVISAARFRPAFRLDANHYGELVAKRPHGNTLSINSRVHRAFNSTARIHLECKTEGLM